MIYSDFRGAFTRIRIEFEEIIIYIFTERISGPGKRVHTKREKKIGRDEKKTRCIVPFPIVDQKIVICKSRFDV